MCLRTRRSSIFIQHLMMLLKKGFTINCRWDGERQDFRARAQCFHSTFYVLASSHLCVYISLYKYIKTLREIKRATTVIHNPIALTQVYPHAYTLFNYTSHTPMLLLPELEEARSIHWILVYIRVNKRAWSTPSPHQPPLLP